MTEHSPSVGASEYIERVLASGLLERDEIDRVLASYAPTEKGKTIAKYLVDAGKLTSYQAGRILRGKTEGFQLGQYRVLESIGRGGMGRVYKAVHQTMGRFVALKVLAPSLMKTDRARVLFQREVRAAARLNHPNIVTAYDANHSGDRFFLVMEFVDGPNLSQLVKEIGRLPVIQACEYVRQAAIGLEHAHSLGLVHRDVKPANLLVQQTPNGPQVKILDFGLALITAGDGAVDPSHTVATGVPGTPDYIAPEQAKDHHRVDGRADLYSLGCTFYYLLTGQAPFPGGTALEKVNRHGNEPPVSIQTLRPEVPDEVAGIVHKLLAKNPQWRYQKAADLAADLANVLQGKKPDWTAPARPSESRPDTIAGPGSGDDMWERGEDGSGQSGNTIPATQVTSELTPPPIPRRRQKKAIWPFVVAAVVVAFGVVLGAGLLVRAVIGRG